MPVALPGLWGRVLNPTPAHMGRTCPGTAVHGQTLSCPLVPQGWPWWGAAGDQREAAYTVGRGQTEAGEPDVTFRAQARRSAQSRNHRPSCLPLPVAASSCADAGCKCPPLSCPPPKPACRPTPRLAPPAILQRRELPTRHLVPPAACQAAELPHGQAQAGPSCSLAIAPPAAPAPLHESPCKTRSRTERL